MPVNTDKIDNAALALLYLTLHDGHRAWKGFDWGVLGTSARKGHDRRSRRQGEIGGLYQGRIGAVEEAV